MMKTLCDRIMRDGHCLDGGILRVDSFLNHQIDPCLMKQMAEELHRLFDGCGATKILTIEASGIAPSIMLGYEMGLPVVFAKKQKPSTMADFLATTVHSFTKQRDYTIIVGRNYLTADDRILFIDDFLAYGNSALGIIDLCRQAGAGIVGMGFIIEKDFQHGRQLLQREGISHIESLAIIESLDNCQIKIKED